MSNLVLIILIDIFLIIFLMDLFFTITSLNIKFHLIFPKTFNFYVEFSPNFFNCYFFVFHCFFIYLFFSISSLNVCLIKNLTSLFFQICF